MRLSVNKSTTSTLFVFSISIPSVKCSLNLMSTGSQILSVAEGEVKVRKKPTCKLSLATVKHHQRPEGARRACGPRSKESRWGSLGTRGSRYRRSIGMATFPTTSERLKRATRKSTMLRGTVTKVELQVELKYSLVYRRGLYPEAT